MASKDQLREDIRRTTLPRLPVPTATEGAGRLFDWADALSSDARHAFSDPNTDSDALASDFALVSSSMEAAMASLLRHFRQDPGALKGDQEVLARYLEAVRETSAAHLAMLDAIRDARNKDREMKKALRRRRLRMRSSREESRNP